MPEKPRRFYISDARSLICKNGNTSVALPSHSPEADRCSRVFLQTMPTGFFHKQSSVNLPSYSPEADRCSRVFLRTIPTGFFHKHSSASLPLHSPEADRCSRVFLQTMPTGFFHKHSSGRRIAVTSLPRPPEIPCFFFPQSCRASSISTLPPVCRHTLPKLTGAPAFSFRQCRRASFISTLPAVAMRENTNSYPRRKRIRVCKNDGRIAGQADTFILSRPENII